jgi:L-alanine-DL-glutamate epimerase-like enolase superfamily enzyme
MGDFDFMLNQIGQKIADGFTCIKLKVGSLDFDKECSLLAHIRNQFSKKDITIRLDANGAFSPADALLRLDRLAEFDIHSIEQPIKAGLPDMQTICSRSPIPIALDEELIEVEGLHDKTKMIEDLRPGFLVLKPTLHGGFSGCAEWIQLAERYGTGWWVTSALESNIGLNAICQFTANYNPELPQGLGTGMIYESNIPSPLTVANGTIFTDQQRPWDVRSLGW